MSQTDGSGTSYFTCDNTGLLVGERLPGGTRFYYLYHGLGNVVGLTNSTGAVVNTYAYEPHGKVASDAGTTANPWRFGGSYGAHREQCFRAAQIGQRFYDPSLGRWTQQGCSPTCR
jgi:RHS repeat-associated protein